ncbi:MAG: efflux RND transporter periplasmic adaptor subunit [Bacteroidia bacterium]|nr:efflux RND transporter periplasmic adaptor subunit [Bacteroidia bacterium]
MKWKRLAVWAVLAGVLAWVIYQRLAPSSAATGSPRGPGGPPQALRARVYVVKPEPLANAITVSGTLLANEEVQLTSEANGKVTGIFFDEGGRVTKGQLLVQLNNAEPKAQLEQAKSRLALLEAQEYRQRVLLEKEAVSQQEYDIVANDLRAARTEIELIEARLLQTQIVAPFGGTVGIRRVAVGSYVRAGDPIASLQNLDVLKIEFAVPENYAQQVRPGTEITFRVRNTTQAYTARVFAREPKIDPATRTVLVRAQAPNRANLVPGAFADVALTLGVDPAAVVVPTQCVLTEQSGQLVYKVVQGKVLPVRVEIGGRYPAYVHIREGLATGDTVLVSGILQARPGSPVTATEVVTGPLVGTQPLVD